jgi:tight adherence protein B
VSIPPAALLYGMAVGVAGMCLAAAMSAATRDRISRRLGAATDVRRRPTDRKKPGTHRDDRVAGRGWERGFRSYVLAHAFGQVVGFTIGFRLAGPVGGLGGAVGLSLLLESSLARKRARARERADEQVREVLTALAAGTRAGLSLRRALQEAVADAEPPIREYLERALHRMDVGEPIEAALEEFAGGSSDARLVTTLLSVHGRTGGDLPSLLDEVTDIVGRRTETRRQARALTAQGRASGAVLAVLPVAFVGLLSGTSGSGLGAFYRTATGSMLLLSGLVLQGVGFLWLRRIARAGGSA